MKPQECAEDFPVSSVEQTKQRHNERLSDDIDVADSVKKVINHSEPERAFTKYISTKVLKLKIAVYLTPRKEKQNMTRIISKQ